MKTNIISIIAALLTASVICTAQTTQSQIIECGGTGPYKSIAVGDASLTTHMIYRPADIKSYVQEHGRIPVLLYANGACANSSLEMSRLLSEVASYGYIAISIGPYDEHTDIKFYNQWRSVMRGGYPETKTVAVMGNGEKLTPYTPEERAALEAEQEAARKTAAAEEPRFWQLLTTRVSRPAGSQDHHP